LGVAYPSEEKQRRKKEKSQGSRNDTERMSQPLRKAGQPEIQ
jgi:hypothetical protein